MNQKNKVNLFYYFVFLCAIIIGAFLFINRYIFGFMPSSNWRILLDHLTAGFLVPLIFYIGYLGIGSFFNPNRKIIYRIRWFIIMTCLALIMPVVWDGLIQGFRDIDQITSEIIGICLSWAYFLSFRKIKLAENKTKKEAS